MASTIAEQEALVEQLQQITGEPNVEDAREALFKQQWNFEAAVQSHLGTSESQPTPSADTIAGSSNNTNLRQRGAAAIQPHTQHANDSPTRVRGVNDMPLSLPEQLMKALVGLLSSSLAVTLGKLAQASGDIDPLAAAKKFTRQFESEYALTASSSNERESVTFLEDTFNNAANRARQFDKLLVVYLHSRDHPDTGSFCRDVLSHPSLVNLINDQAFMWGGDVEHEDGYRVSIDLKAPTFPFIGVIAVEGSRKNQRLKLLMRTEGWGEEGSVDGLVAQLQSLLTQHETTIVGRHANRNAGMERHRLREEQDNALQMSMEQDRRRGEEQRMAAEQVEEDQRAAEECEQHMANELQAKRDRVTEEPSSSTAGPGKTVTLRLNLPGGGKLQRRFLETDTMSVVFDYVDVEIVDQALDISVNYTLDTNFPKRAFSPEEDADTTLADAGLSPKAALFLHDLEA